MTSQYNSFNNITVTEQRKIMIVAVVGCQDREAVQSLMNAMMPAGGTESDTFFLFCYLYYFSSSNSTS